MSAFYVGQRVRKVRGQWNIGNEYTVIGSDADPTGRSLCLLPHSHGHGECAGAPITYEPGTQVWGYPEDFEPIVPPGLESLAEIDTLYEPEEVTA